MKGLSEVSRERLAVCAYFGLLGLVCATWTSSIDDLKVLLGLDKRQLGWLLVSGPMGNLVSFTFAGALFARLGARRGVQLASSAYLGAVLGLALSFMFSAPVPVWCLVIALFAASGNLLNIGVNTVAGVVEKHAGRPIMSSFHGVFSASCLVAGLIALAATASSISVEVRFFVALTITVLVHVAVMRRLPADDAAPVQTKKERRWHRPDRALVGLGLAALVIMGCEGAITDWVGVFYRETLLAPPGRVKWGFCAVVGLMAAGRFVSDSLVARFTARRVLHFDCVLVAGGLCLALFSPWLRLEGLALHLTATAGFAITGFGISGLVPILYSKANRTKAMPPASAVTFLGTMGFLGYFVGPPLIGHLSTRLSLSAAFGFFAALILLCLFVNPDESDASSGGRE